MFLEEIELYGYIRFNLNSFKKIKLVFTKKIQAILGTNGSGKSSLMEELSPLPAESKNFTKDGYKIVKYRHRGKRYILSSRFDPVFHSIKIEGEDEELNPGGTITVQRDLVKKIFNIDAKKHALAIGKHEFHSMGVETRKEWFRLLSDENYDYAINTFKRIKDEFRDITGALKLARNKLVSQSSKMMPKGDLEALIRDCEELYKVVEFMIDNRNSPTQSLDQTKHDIEHQLKDLEDYSTMIIESIQDLDRFLSDPLVKNELTDIRDASSLAFFVSTKLNELKDRKVELFKEHKKCSDNLELFEKTKLFKVASISTELEELKKKKAQLEGSLIYNFPTYDPQHFLENLEIIIPNLLELVLEIPINKESTKFTRDGYKVMVDRRQDCSRTIDILKVNIKNNKESIDHHLKHKDEPSLSCPKCKHSWNPKFNQNVIKDIEIKIEEDSKKIKENEAIIEDLDIQIEEFDKWVQHLEAIKELSRTFGEMKDFWSLIMKKEVLFENPRSIANIVTLYKTDLFAQRSLGEVNKRIDEELEKLDLAEHTQGFDYQQATITIDRISTELELIANEEIRLNSIKNVANNIVRAIRRIDGCEQGILDREKEIDNLVNTFNEDSLRILFNQILRSFQSELAIKEKAINDEKMQESTLKSLETEIANLEELSEAYKLVLTELSPTQGIIAEGIFGFMKLFIKKMNKFISTIWSYPLVVQPCSSEEGKIELSYKFPLMAGTAHKPRPDVSEGSASMRQVINLSFVISALKALGLGEGSLFLDEFGSAMDPVHKAKTARMVADIVENEKFSQIFIISHDVAQYSSLDNTEVAIINSANVIIPTGCIYNQHVEFE